MGRRRRPRQLGLREPRRLVLARARRGLLRGVNRGDGYDVKIVNSRPSSQGGYGSRLDDATDAIRDFAAGVEATTRLAAGFGKARRISTAVTRARWGLVPTRLETDGVVPDDRVLESLAWLQTVYDTIEDAPQLPDAPTILDELGDLVGTARRLLGLSRTRLLGATCPCCGRGTIFADPAEADLAVCVNLDCRTDEGLRPEWRGLAEWAALQLPAA